MKTPNAVNDIKFKIFSKNLTYVTVTFSSYNTTKQ